MRGGKCGMAESFAFLQRTQRSILHNNFAGGRVNVPAKSKIKLDHVQHSDACDAALAADCFDPRA